MGERENASVVRRTWELIEARQGDEAASKFAEDLAAYWPTQGDVPPWVESRRYEPLLSGLGAHHD